MFGITYAYVDGESHFIRNEDYAKKAMECESLRRIRRTQSMGGVLHIREECHFFWDTDYFNRL